MHITLGSDISPQCETVWVVLSTTSQCKSEITRHLLDITALQAMGQSLWLGRPCQRLLLHIDALEQLYEGDEGEVDLPRRSHVHQGVHKPGILPA